MHPGPLPPLQPVPHLMRLLAPDESLIYTARLHPFYGSAWLLPALVLGVLGWWVKPLWVVVAVLLFLYRLPFNNFELAITSHRMLLRHGRFGVETEGILAHQLGGWKLRQNLPQRLLHAGTVTVSFHQDGTLRTLNLRWLRNPMTFLEALETLQLNPHHG